MVGYFIETNSKTIASGGTSQNQSIKVAVFVVTDTVAIYDGYQKFQVKEKVYQLIFCRYFAHCFSDNFLVEKMTSRSEPMTSFIS